MASPMPCIRLGKSYGDVVVRLPTDAEILRIDHLRNYVRRQSWPWYGLCDLKKRISHTLC